MTVAEIVLLLTIALMGLIAGLFFGWSCSVMPGLRRLSDREFVAAMRAANRSIWLGN